MAEKMTFDHYEVLTREDGALFELGRGAMGITYKAFDTNLRVNVALKVINAKFLESEVAQQRFMREARAAAQLRHPNVASVFHLGTSRDAFFYAIEFVDGETVETFIKRQGPLDPVIALRITLQVTRALGAAAKHHLVHRGIKPANVMLVGEDDDFPVKVIDFGLAKSIKHEENDDLATLSMGGFVGTAHFASPEQLEEREIDVRSDIYSLGITLWYMLVGEAPFGGSLAQVMSQHLHKPPPLEKLQGLPASLRAVVGHMIEKEPAKRPQTPAALRGELENCLAEIQAVPKAAKQDFATGVAETPPSPAVAPQPVTARKSSRAIVWAVAAVVLVGVGLLGFLKTRQSKSIANTKSIAVLPFENRSEDKANAYFADGIQDEILTRLSKIADLKVISRTSTQHFKSAPENLPEIAKQLGVMNILEGSVQKTDHQVRVNVQLIDALSDAHLWADTFDRNLTDIFAIESEIAGTVAETLQAKLTGPEQHAIAARPTENTEAYQLYQIGRHSWDKRTGPDLQKAIRYFKQAIDEDPSFAQAYAGLADSYVLLSGVGVATPQESFPLAEAAAKKALELDDKLAQAHASLAFTNCNYRFDFASGRKEFESAISLNKNYATAHHWYGLGVFLTLSRFDEATAELKRAVELDPLSLIINADLGRTYFFARRYDEAIEQLRKTLKMDRENTFYYTHWNLGRTLELKGMLQEAIREYQEALRLNDDPWVLGLLAHAYASSGNKSEAQEILKQLQERSTKHYVSAYGVALVYLGLGNNEEALRWLEKSYQDRAGVEIVRIRTDPFLDPLRGDPRFEALAEKVVPQNTR